MNKFLTALIGFFSAMYNFENIGHCMNQHANSDIISFRPETEDTENLLPELKKIGREDLQQRFDYASQKLINIIKECKKIRDIVDIDALISELQLRKNVLKKNDPKLLENNLFTEVPISLVEDYTNNSRKLSAIQDFILFNFSLKDALWYVPMGYEKNFPILDFVPDQTLMYRNLSANPVLKENIICLLMAGIEMDLLANPNLRGNCVPQSTRQLFTYFERYKNYDNDPVKKIYSYQKYLTKEQNDNLSLQLLSIYLKFHEVYNCEEYMSQLAMQLFFLLDCKYFLPSIKSWSRNLTNIVQHFLYSQLLLEPKHNIVINNFVCKVLNKHMFDVNLNKNVQLRDALEYKLNRYFKNQIRDKFLKFKKVLATKNDQLFLKKFIYAMCNSCTSTLYITLSFCDFYDLRQICKMMFIDLSDKN